MPSTVVLFPPTHRPQVLPHGDANQVLPSVRSSAPAQRLLVGTDPSRASVLLPTWLNLSSLHLPPGPTPASELPSPPPPILFHWTLFTFLSLWRWAVPFLERWPSPEFPEIQGQSCREPIGTGLTQQSRDTRSGQLSTPFPKSLLGKTLEATCSISWNPELEVTQAITCSGICFVQGN